jgi:ubiquinone/menaquinone biosynthesis C-methylase UbiE
MNNNGYYDEIGRYYDKDATNYDVRYWSNPVLQKIRQSFREEVKRYPAQSMLELGFGTGLDLVHFARVHPARQIFGIDISVEMCNLTSLRIENAQCGNIEIRKGSIDDIALLFPNRKFDIIYIFFGALNTTADLKSATKSISGALSPGGILVLSFVNKWYLTGILLDLLRFRIKKALARLKPVWGGYSPGQFLASSCYTPKQITMAFEGMEKLKRRGFCIVHPAWYFTTINRKIRRLSRYLWNIDKLLNKTPAWRFGEYILMVLQK